MLLKDFLPKPENQDLVHLYRIVHFNFDKNTSPGTKAYPPRPEQVLSFFPRETEKAEYSGKKFTNHRSLLTGQHDVVFNRIVPRDFLCFQIVFQPTGLYRIIGVPATELRNQYLDAEIFFHSDLRQVNEQFFHARNYDEMIAIADNFIKSVKSQVTRTTSPMDEVSKILLGKEGNTSLDWLAKESSLSIRQFERNFSQRAGVTPKIFCRIARFDKAFRMKNEFPSMDWLSIALACGYYDYQHMVKDYKDFTSFTPPEFHQIENKSPERSLGLHEGFYNSRIV